MKRFLLGPLQLDASQRVLSRDGEIIALSPKSFDILLVLVENAGQVVSRDAIRQQVWKDAFIEDANITNNISQLRNLLRQHLGVDPIKTYSKRGYQLIGLSPCMEAPAERPAENPSGYPLVRSTANRFQPRRSGLRAVLVAVLLTVALGSVAGTIWRKANMRKFPSTAAHSLAIMNFRNLSMSHDQDWMGTAMQEKIGADMTYDGAVRLVSGQRSTEVEHEMTLVPTKIYDDDVIEELGKRLDCDLILVGSFESVGDELRIDVQLRSTKSGAQLWEFSQIAPQKDLLQLADNAGSDLRKTIGVSPLQARAEADDSMSTSLDGLKLYAEGLHLLREDKYVEAAQVLAQAVRASPQAPLPHLALANAWNQLGLGKNSAAEARLALDTSEGLPQKQKSVLHAAAYEYLNDWPHALEIYSRLHTNYPDDLDYVLGVTRAQIELGKAKEVLQTLDALRQTSIAARNDPRISLQEAGAADEISDHRAQLVYAGDAVRQSQAISALELEARALISEGSAWDYMGDNHRGLQKAQNAEEISQRIGNNRDLARALSEEGQIERALQFPEAEPTLLKAYAVAENAGLRLTMSSLLNALGNVRVDHEDWEGARKDYQKELDIEVESGDPGGQVAPLLGLAEVAANTDEPERERDYATRAQSYALPMGDLEDLTFVYEYLGQADEREGNLKDARTQLEQGIDIAQKSGNPDRIAFLLQDMLRFEVQVGNMAAARQLQAKVLAMRPQNIYVVAASKVDEATLTLEEGHPENVIAPMTGLATAQPLKTYPAGRAWMLVAEAEIANGNIVGAQGAIDKALRFGRQSPNKIDFLIPDLLVAARIDAAEGHTAKAQEELSALLRDAQDLNNPGLQLEVRLAQGEMQKRVDPTGAQLLRSVKLEAWQRGFGLIAHKATVDLS